MPPQSDRVTDTQGSSVYGWAKFFVPDFNKLPYSLRSQGDKKERKKEKRKKKKVKKKKKEKKKERKNGAKIKELKKINKMRPTLKVITFPPHPAPCILSCTIHGKLEEEKRATCAAVNQ